jgi:hypothetical protein
VISKSSTTQGVYQPSGHLHTANGPFVRYGAPLGAIQGVGYVNELIGRLTNTPVRHSLQTNSTLLSSPETFPLNRTIYVDFSHDNLIVAVLTSMGLFNQTDGPLDTTKITKHRTWITSEMVPFSGHMTVEKLSCTARHSSRPFGPRESVTRSEGDEGEEEYVRIFVNDAKQPLHFCGADSGGMCRLEEFVRSQEYARNDGFGDFAACAYTGERRRLVG